MSKKNNRKTRQKAHNYALQREKEILEKRKRKLEQSKDSEDICNKEPSPSITKDFQKLMVSVQDAKVVKKRKKKAIRIRRNVTIRGIRIKDSASKKKLREVLAAEEFMTNMEDN